MKKTILMCSLAIFTAFNGFADEVRILPVDEPTLACYHETEVSLPSGSETSGELACSSCKLLAGGCPCKNPPKNAQENGEPETLLASDETESKEIVVAIRRCDCGSDETDENDSIIACGICDCDSNEADNKNG